MSDDYAALLTTLIVAVLAVGTIQTYSMMKRWSDTQAEQTRVLIEARVRVADALHRNAQPTEDDLKAARESVSTVARMARKGMLPYGASLVWIAVVVTLGDQQLRILKWAATAGDPADPELAKSAFYYVSAAIVLLLAEGFARGLVVTFRTNRQQFKPWKNYPRSTRDQADRAVRAYRRTGQLPAAPTPPASAGQSDPHPTP
ncbi:hypothetical protein [Streptomyces sp. 021-4]|uniref:hypothetical protein n=1 Tax=Streptomyces sp. 021-4 TaxID=2789260 RepID=UPI0039F49260